MGAEERVWLVTGSSRGLGRAIVVDAAAAGDIVVATARQPAMLDDVVAAHPDRVEAVALDVTDTASAQAVVAAAERRHGRIDVLVNNAGRGLIGAAEENTEDELRALFDLHVHGPAALVRAVLPGMRGRGSGAIVSMSSTGGQFTYPGLSAYCATKFALEGYSEALAAEVGPFGIRVLIVEPGGCRTEFCGSSLVESAVIDAYADTVGVVRTATRNAHGHQPGDPARVAAAIRTALDADRTPLRLPLGDDAVDGVLDHLTRVADEVREWEPVSRTIAFDT